MSELNPKLKENALRKMVRIITMHFNFYSNYNSIKYKWTMSKKSCQDLKKYINNIDSKQMYCNAINTIKDCSKIIPDSLIDDLYNINNWEKNHSINIEKYLTSSDIITNDYNRIFEVANSFQLHISYMQDSYILLDLFRDRQAVYILDFENNITSIRIEKKVNNQFVTLLEFDINDIEKYKNIDITAILNS